MQTWKLLLTSSVLALACSLSAADNGVGAPIDLSNETITPEPMETPMPSLRKLNPSPNAYVNILLEVDEEGYVTKATVDESSDKSLEAPVVRAVKKWRYYPAYDDGKRTSCKILQPIRFKSDMMFTNARKKGSRDPKVIARVSPKLNEYEETLDGEVMVRVNLDDKGKITETFVSHSSNSRLNQAALAAVSQWHFKPAIIDGEAIASKVMVPFHFQGNGDAIEEETTSYVDRQVCAVYQPQPRITSDIADIDGRVEIVVSVDPSGYVSEAKVLNSSDDRLNTVALNTVKRWKFEPAMRDGAPVESKTVQPFVFGNGYNLSATRKQDSLTESASQALQTSLPTKLDGLDGLGLGQFEVND